MRPGTLAAMALLLGAGGLPGEREARFIDPKTGGLGDVPDLTVGAIRFGRAEKPTGTVKIWAWRKGAWRVSEPVDAAGVEWRRLMEYDRVEPEEVST
mgnify:CR=1 FL=1